ncbi:cysteine--tRNA ligase [Candidatus Pacearchaeota archaeon]|nr:cysteine--tRNA ligase [Candidatus Pacearchaeota archaeon]
MDKIYLYNTLIRKKELFIPIKKSKVSMYTCGPTVYWYQHIGNLRTMLLNDFLKRVLLHCGYKVKHVMNITDVDDKTIKASMNENISLKDLTTKYEEIFLIDLNSLNIITPNILVRATDSIKDMVKLIKTLQKKGYAYKTSDGIYFSILKFKNYGKLAILNKLKKTKARIISDNYDKSNVKDFALWKFYTENDGVVFWETEIGKGRPGWHIECSAMSMKYLGDNFDIHTGGTDLIFPHHTNEIAQSEATTNKKFVNYWIHGGFLTMKESKMSKSLGNIITLKELIQQTYSPMHFRYLCLQTHYRKALNFSWENLDAARSAHKKLERKIIQLKKEKHKGADKKKEYEKKFHEAIYDDLNFPRALQIIWKIIEDESFDSEKKLRFIEHLDSVLGLNIKEISEDNNIAIPPEVQKLIDSRERLRKAKLWAEADIIRERIKEFGYQIEDTPDGPQIEKLYRED